ncbi:MAG: 23S rRNA (uracil(1939)-C(5))-methyltransferase RlmD [Candidatus Omnitrophota bacterium]
MHNICKHFGSCGGCSYQDIPYQEQLYNKEKLIKELLSAHDFNHTVQPINAYPEWFYRNKMEFSFSSDRILRCGLYKKGDHAQVVDLEECLIFSPYVGEILGAVKNFAIQKNYTPYNKFSFQGFLRNLVIRKTQFTNEIMIGLVTTSKEKLNKDEFIKTLLSLSLAPSLKSIYWIINDSMSDAVMFEKKELLYGSAFIQEELSGFRFSIGIDSFFQINSTAIQDFYSKIRSYAALTGGERVLDLFCGMGCIGIFLARDAKFVWAVELQEEVIASAWENARMNAIDNISFFASDVRKFLNSQGMFYKDTELVVLNPPRSGLSNKIKRAVVRLTPHRIIYSSCNPSTLFSDLSEFLKNYTIERVEPFDFFPHTPHVECLVLLRKK